MCRVVEARVESNKRRFNEWCRGPVALGRLWFPDSNFGSRDSETASVITKGRLKGDTVDG